jgi:pectin methylesterase-like acyl-CoA thioesterase
LEVQFQTTIFTMLFPSNCKLIVVTTALISAVESKDIYVSPSGTGTGSQSAPYGSIQAAVNAASAGDVILLRAGTYKPTTNIQITKSGTSASPITLRSYQEEQVVLDGENLPG